MITDATKIAHFLDAMAHARVWGRSSFWHCSRRILCCVIDRPFDVLAQLAQGIGGEGCILVAVEFIGQTNTTLGGGVLTVVESAAERCDALGQCGFPGGICRRLVV